MCSPAKYLQAADVTAGDQGVELRMRALRTPVRRTSVSERSSVWPAPRVLTWATLVLALILAACSGADDGLDAQRANALEGALADANTGGSATPTISTVAVAPTQLPQAVNSTTVVRSTAADPGATITDPSGNTVSLYRWALWPEAIDSRDPYAENAGPLFGPAGRGISGDRIAAVEIEVCASANQLADQELFRGRFEPRPAADATPTVNPMGGYSAAPLLLQPMLGEQFVWPSAGECRRGWQGLRLSADLFPGSHESLRSAPPDFRYVAVSDTAETFGDQTAFVWSDLPEVGADDAAFDRGTDAAQSPAQRFDTGALANWSTTVLGWARVPDSEAELTPAGVPYVTPPDGYGLVAASLEICAGDEPALPAFGMAGDGWNLIGQFRQGTPWGRGYSQIRLPNPGECALGWLAFALPDTMEPTAVFMTDVSDPTADWLFWELGEAQLEQPTLTGFPGRAQREAAADACAIDRTVLDLTLTSEFSGPWALSNEYAVEGIVAVPAADGRIDIHFRDGDLTENDIPATTAGEGKSVVATLQNRSGGSIDAGTYSAEFGGDLLASVYAIEGSAGGRLLFDTTSVVVERVTDDHICGTFVAGDGADAVSGAFAAPFWLAD